MLSYAFSCPHLHLLHNGHSVYAHGWEEHAQKSESSRRGKDLAENLILWVKEVLLPGQGMAAVGGTALVHLGQWWCQSAESHQLLVQHRGEKPAFQTQDKEVYGCLLRTCKKEQGTMSVRNSHYMPTA